MNAAAASSKCPNREISFRLLFEQSADAIFLLDPATESFVECNRAAVDLMRAADKQHVLISHPADLSPELQPDGVNSREKTGAVIRAALAHGSHRFEWVARRLDGTVFPMDVLLTVIEPGPNPLIATVCRDITAQKAAESATRASEAKFRALFERSADAMTLFDPERGVFLAMNAASRRAAGLSSPDQVVNLSPEALAPERQPDGRPSHDVTRHIVAQTLKNGSHRFEWLLRRVDGHEYMVEVVSTAIPYEGRTLLYTVARDIGDRFRIEAELRSSEEQIRALNQSLEQRIAERTAELRASEARARILVEHAPEGVVVFDGETGQFLECNENACRLFGLRREALLQLGPWDVSPQSQPGGRPSRELAMDYIQQVLEGKTPVFEWTHRHMSGRLIPCEVRLVALPDEGRVLVRGSVIDNTERRHRERIQLATYEIAFAVLEAKEIDQFYGKVHDIVRRLMPAENFYIALLDDVSQLIHFPYHVDQFSSRPEPRPMTTGLTGEVMRLGRPLLITEEIGSRKRQVGSGVVIDGIAELPYEESGRPAATWLGVPLRHRGRMIGVMAVQDYRDSRAYGDDELQVLTFVAGQVALAISRKRADEQLRKSEEKFKSLFELSPLGISRIDWEGRFLQVNPAFARMVGRTPDEVLELTYWDFTPRKYEPLELMVLEEVKKAGHFGPFEKEYIHRDGHLVPVVLHAVLVRAPDGEDQLWGIVEDITERKRTEAALRESEQNFRALFEASSQGVMLNDEKEFLAVNDAAARIFGYRSDEFVGKHPRDMAAPFQPDGEPSGPAAERHINDCLREGQARFEWLSRRADGSDVPLDVVLTSISIGGRKIIQAMVTDISERKRAEAELLKALERERELSQLKSSFVSMVSHEFRTPLGVIQSSAEILHDYLERLEPDERRELLDSITKNVRRMAGLMEEVLVLGRLDAGKMPFAPAPVDLGILLGRLVDEVHSATDYLSPIQLSADGLPQQVQIDDKLVTHILSNLLSNAVKYSPAGSPVEFRVELRDFQLIFNIRDRGIGIPEVEQGRLFEAFQRGSNVGNRAGTGLGLVIVKRCVELHSGRIELNSRPGEGTTVVVRLPLPVRS